MFRECYEEKNEVARVKKEGYQQQENEMSSPQGRNGKVPNVDPSDWSISSTGLPEDSYYEMTFYTWRDQPGLDEALRAARDFIKGKYQILTLAGPPGVGKTHLACAIAWAWMEEYGVRVTGGVKFSSADRILDNLRDAYEGYQGFRSAMSRYERCELLIIDDLGVEKGTSWAQSKLDSLIDYRYANKLPLVVTTNGKGEDLPPRIADRLRDVRKSKVIQISAESYREKPVDVDQA